MEPRLGVISPDGKFYPCGYGCHEELCKKVCQELGYKTVYDVPYKDRDPNEKLYTTYNDTLYHKGWAIIAFQINGMPLFMHINKYSPAQHEIVDKLVDEFSCMTSEQLSEVCRDNRENYNDYGSCGFPYSNDLKMIRYWLNYERSDYQPNYTKLVSPHE